MAAIRYFKKMSPETPPVCANGSRVEFTTLDHLVGYHASTNDYVQSELDRMMRERRYGLSEITAEEFKRDYIEKKKSAKPLERIWREEIGVGTVRAGTLLAQLGAEKVSSVAAVVTEKPTVVDGAPVTSPPPEPQKANEPVKVTAGKRPKRADKSK